MNVAPFEDLNQLNADLICTDIGPNRAQIDFVEIYDPAVPDVPVPTFIISFATNAPYKATAGGVSYLRRPSCQIDQDFCSTTDYVKSCTENLVQFSNGFVISQDTVYIIPGGSQYVGCSSADDSCCSYVVPGFCPRTADDSVFKIKLNKKPQQQQQAPQHERPHHERPHHNDGDDDEDDDDRRDNFKKQVNIPNQDKKNLVNEQKDKDAKQKDTLQKDAKQKEELKELLLNHAPEKKEVDDLPVVFTLNKSEDKKAIKPLIPLRVVNVERHTEDDEGDEDKKRK